MKVQSTLLYACRYEGRYSAHVRRYDVNERTGFFYPSKDGVCLTPQQLMDLYYQRSEIMKAVEMANCPGSHFHIGSNCYIEVFQGKATLFITLVILLSE